MLFRSYVFSIKNAENILFQNKENIQYMINQGLRSNKIILLPGSGVNLEEHQYVSYPIEGDSIVFLAVIRIMKDKGIDEYLEAAEQIKKIHPNCIFQLVGEYEEDTRARYEPKIKDLMKRNMIQYFGHIDNVSEKMGKANVIVHPSYHEGLSNVLLEAAASGRPVIATNVTGCRETFLDGISGISCEAKSSSSLQEAINTFLQLTHQEWDLMGQAGRKLVEEQFDRKIVITTYKNIISKFQER